MLLCVRAALPSGLCLSAAALRVRGAVRGRCVCCCALRCGRSVGEGCRHPRGSTPGGYPDDRNVMRLPDRVSKTKAEFSLEPQVSGKIDKQKDIHL